MKKDNTAEQLAALADIRDMVAKSARFPSVSGTAGLFAGLLALAGTALAADMMGCSLFDTGCYAALFDEPDRVSPGLGPWLWLDFGTVLVLSLSAGVGWALRKARRQRVPLRGGVAGRLLLAFGTPLVTGGLCCLALLKHGHYGWLAPATLLFYGLALLAAAPFTITAVRYLGWTEVATGLVVAYFPATGLVGWAFGFGLLHLVYGGWIRYTRQS